MSERQSQFIEVESIADSDYISFFGNSVNRRISAKNFFDAIRDKVFTPFIYPSVALLQAADLEADEDNPTYVRVEENQYKLYKITNFAPGSDDISLNNGTTATFQIEYRDIGFVIGPNSSTPGAIATYSDSSGAILSEGPVISEIGEAIVSVPSLSQESFIKVGPDDSVELRTKSQLKTDLSLPDNTVDALSEKVEGPASSADDQIALFDGITGKLLKAGQTLAQVFNGWLVQLYNIFPRTVNTYADIATTPLLVGQIIRTKGYSVAGIGGADFIGVAGSVTDNGGTQINSATVGVYAKAISEVVLYREMFSSDAAFNAAKVGQVSVDSTERLRAPSFIAGSKEITGATLRDAYVVARDVNGLTDCHGYADRTEVNNVTDYGGYGVFDATVRIIGSHSHDHVYAFQDRCRYDGSGQIQSLGGFYSFPAHGGTGHVHQRRAVDLYDVAIATGTLGDNIGVFVRDLTVGDGIRASFLSTQSGGDGDASYTFFCTGTAHSIHRGNFILGMSANDYGRTLQLSGFVGTSFFADTFSDAVDIGGVGSVPLYLTQDSSRRLAVKAGSIDPVSDGAYALGSAANRYSSGYINALVQKPSASVTPADNGDLIVQATSNTQITFKLKGSDGVVRSGSITLA